MEGNSKGFILVNKTEIPDKGFSCLLLTIYTMTIGDKMIASLIYLISLIYGSPCRCLLFLEVSVIDYIMLICVLSSSATSPRISFVWWGQHDADGSRGILGSWSSRLQSLLEVLFKFFQSCLCLLWRNLSIESEGRV